jgi:hypothetical protein
VHREGALDTDAERHLADGEGLAGARAVPADHDALEHLDAGPAAFDDLDVHLERVTRAEGGDVGAQHLRVQCVQGVHREVPFSISVQGMLGSARRARARRP